MQNRLNSFLHNQHFEHLTMIHPNLILLEHLIILHDQIFEKELVSQFYEKILLECSGSIYMSESRKKYRKLRGDDL